MLHEWQKIIVHGNECIILDTCDDILDSPGHLWLPSQIAKFMGPTRGPPGSCRPKMDPILAPSILLSGLIVLVTRYGDYPHYYRLHSFDYMKLKTNWLTFHFSGDIVKFNGLIIPPEQRSCWGVYWFHSVHQFILPSVRPSVLPSFRLSRLPCPLCNIFSSGWILSILATNHHYHERVCHTQWPLTLTYTFKVIQPWLRKSCRLCSVYSSGWILFIFGTNDHYY